MEAFPTLKKSPLYEQLASEMAHQINSGVFKPGDRLPSVRQISRQKKFSVTTVLLAYQLLENTGSIESRPQSGYYVRTQPLPSVACLQPETSTPSFQPAPLKANELTRQVLNDQNKPDLVQFGAAIPSPDLLPTARLNRILSQLAHHDDPRYNICGYIKGCVEIRMQIARRAFLSGCNLSPEEILVTCGCMEALHLALRSVCKTGDLVAIESPTYFGVFHALETLGLHALEIPTHHQDGISLEALSFALEHHPVKAVLVISNFNNPLGSCMPDENKRRLVELLTKFDIPLIEDDIEGELSFDDQRPGVCKAYDKKGLVLLCSSFSKDISPSYRVGWIAPGRYLTQVENLKQATTLGSPILQQLAIAQFLESGGYEHHLRKIRRAYAQKVAYMGHSVLRYFPAGTRVTSPSGGFVVWVQLSEKIDSVLLYHQALLNGITLAPGYIFSATTKYRNFIRLNAAYMSFTTERAIEKIGGILSKMMAD